VASVGRVNVLGAAVVAACAWAALLLYQHGGSFLSAFAVWNVMMVAMMLPSLVPWLSLFGPSEVGSFVAGYFSVWAAYCLIAATAQLQLRAQLTVPPEAGALILVAAGAFQFTPLKQACLKKCRSPVGHLLTRWHNTGGRVFRIGLAHGLNCLGCCWALMAVAFALGVMNLWWMAALTVLLFVEKVLPKGELVSRALGAALVIAGAGWLVGA